MQDLLRISLCENAAEVQHGQLPADAGDELHVVLDKEDGNAEFIADELDRIHKLRRLVRVHAGCRLIEEKELGVRCHGSRDFELPLLSVGQVRRKSRGVLIEPENSQKLHGALVHFGFDLLIPAEMRHGIEQAVLVLVFQRRLDVVDDRHLTEQTDVLERAGNAVMIDLDGFVSGDVLPVQQDDALVWLVNAGQQVENCRLAGAVGADETVELSLFDREIEIVHGAQTAEGNAEVFNFH